MLNHFEQYTVMQIFEGLCRNLSDSVAILNTAKIMNMTHDQVKEAVYGIN